MEEESGAVSACRKNKSAPVSHPTARNFREFLGHGPGGRDIHTRAGLPDKAVVALPGTLGCVKGGMAVGHVVGVGREAVAAGLAR